MVLRRKHVNVVKTSSLTSPAELDLVVSARGHERSRGAPPGFVWDSTVAVLAAGRQPVFPHSYRILVLARLIRLRIVLAIYVIRVTGGGWGWRAGRGFLAIHHHYHL